MTTFQLVYGSITLLSTCLWAYIAYNNKNGRLSDILMTFGLASQAFAAFAQPSTVKVTNFSGLALFAASLFLMIRSLYAKRRLEQ